MLEHLLNPLWLRHCAYRSSELAHARMHVAVNAALDAAGGPSYLLCSKTCTDYRERKRLRTDSCAEARRVLVSLAGQEIVDNMLRDPTAILCRSCQWDLCKIAQLFKLVESKQFSALSYHSIYRFHRTPPSLPSHNAHALME